MKDEIEAIQTATESNLKLVEEESKTLKDEITNLRTEAEQQQLQALEENR